MTVDQITITKVGTSMIHKQFFHFNIDIPINLENGHYSYFIGRIRFNSILGNAHEKSIV